MVAAPAWGQAFHFPYGIHYKAVITGQSFCTQPRLRIHPDDFSH